VCERDLLKRETPSGAVVYVYDGNGDLAAEYGSDGSTNPGGVQYLTQDQLGTTRVVTREGESRYQDYLPFGEGLLGGWRAQTSSYTDNSGVTQKFTSKERDVETGLDYFGARYFSGAQGRFTSPDKPFADQNPDDPQSWNLNEHVYRIDSGIGEIA
jgi:RHS repeat-associated protein